MTRVADALREATAKLAATSDTARLDAELLMAHCFGVSRSDLLVRYQGHTTPGDFAHCVERRAAHEPIAYIIGEQEFYGHSFVVGPNVLIPRPDSEIVVETALELRPDAQRVLDLGLGSGALLLSVMLELEGEGVGIDKSHDALAVADENLNRLGLLNKVTIMSRDWQRPNWDKRLGTFDLVLCNPPYVEDDAELDPDVRDYEPASALFAGPDGLDDYRILIPQLGKLLAPGGIALFEIGAAQANPVTEIAQNHGFEVEMRRDLAKRPRVLILSRSN